jgi:hypothetical protein
MRFQPELLMVCALIAAAIIAPRLEGFTLDKALNSTSASHHHNNPGKHG